MGFFYKSVIILRLFNNFIACCIVNDLTAFICAKSSFIIILILFILNSNKLYLMPWFIPIKNNKRKNYLSVSCTFSAERSFQMLRKKHTYRKFLFWVFVKLLIKIFKKYFKKTLRLLIKGSKLFKWRKISTIFKFEIIFTQNSPYF